MGFGRYSALPADVQHYLRELPGAVGILLKVGPPAVDGTDMEFPEVDIPLHTVVLGVADPMAAAHLRRQLMDHPRFDLVATAHNAVQTLYAVEETHASVVLMADDSPGLRGREVLADIAAASPDTYVIITTPGDPAALANEPAVASAVYDNDIYGIYAALDQLADFLDMPKAESPERRTSSDRRMYQDWAKVFAERREGLRRNESMASS